MARKKKSVYFRLVVGVGHEAFELNFEFFARLLFACRRGRLTHTEKNKTFLLISWPATATTTTYWCITQYKCCFFSPINTLWKTENMRHHPTIGNACCLSNLVLLKSGKNYDNGTPPSAAVKICLPCCDEHTCALVVRLIHRVACFIKGTNVAPHHLLRTRRPKIQ